ncbi:MAG TPA: hypothetical protein VGG53_20415 [Mycobacterium sp.]|jgi:hypothetical protein|uniref:hypothetical protein n=1 Tax=Mycobacterium sp. TaxID=1785 RepID=UPI002F42F327
MEEKPAPVLIDDDVEWLTEQIEALKQLGRQDDVDEGQKYDFSIRWGTALAGRLPRLVHYSSRGLLDEADQRRFDALCDELRGLSDLIDRIGLTRPVLTDSAPGRVRRRREPKPAKSRPGLRFRRG